MSYSPNEMLGVASMVCGLGSGTLQKTYANMGEALNDFWERRVIPTKNRHSAELGAQLLPLYGLDARDYRIAWDYSKVAALQENEDQTHARVRADYQAGLIDLYDAQTLLGVVADETKRGVFYGQDASKPTAVKGNWVEADHPRGQPENRGQFVVAASRRMPLEPHQQQALDHLTRALSADEENEPYRQSLADALSHMPKAATSRIVENTKKVTFLATTDEMDALFSNAHQGESGLQGFYDDSTGEMGLDEKNATRTMRGNLYAHELTHAIDGIGFNLSSSEAWRIVWRQELASRDLRSLGKVVKNAQLNEHEGFAEVGAILYSLQDKGSFVRDFPLTYVFWKQKGLI